MVGAAAGVLRNTAAKFAEGHEQHSLQVSLGFHIIHESLDRIAQFAEQAVMRARLVSVRVIAALRDIKDARGQSASNEPRHQLE